MKSISALDAGTLHKRPGLQGPIDDAFMDSFVMVSPTGMAWHEKTGDWYNREMKHAQTHWRKQFRGVAHVTTDNKVTEEQIRHSHLILWGDPSSNAIIKRLLAQLPIQWTKDNIRVGSQTFDASESALVMIYPNPLNPSKYIVLNSGFTFREYDYLNNARQIPKLADWAVIDIKTPVNARLPGAIASEGFFDEHWALKK